MNQKYQLRHRHRTFPALTILAHRALIQHSLSLAETVIVILKGYEREVRPT